MRTALAVLLLSLGALAAPSENGSDWSVDLDARYDTNAGMAVNALSNAELMLDVEYRRGTSFGIVDGPNGAWKSWWNVSIGADLNLHGAGRNLSQAIPSLWIAMSRTMSGWSFGALARARYHFWGDSNANTIEPGGRLNVQFPSFISSDPVSLYAGAFYRFDHRISQADAAAQQDVWTGNTHTASLWVEYFCHNPNSCPFLLPDVVRVSYTLGAGDFVSISGDDIPGSKASAPSTLMDSDTALGYKAYRFGGLSHTIAIELRFSAVGRITAGASHRILTGPGSFTAVDDEIHAGIGF